MFVGDRSRGDGLGFWPVVAAAVAAAGSIVAAKKQSDAEKSAAKAAEEQARLAARAQRIESAASAKRMKTYLIVGGVAAVLGLGAWALLRRRKRGRR